MMHGDVVRKQANANHDFNFERLLVRKITKFEQWRCSLKLGCRIDLVKAICNRPVLYKSRSCFTIANVGLEDPFPWLHSVEHNFLLYGGGVSLDVECVATFEIVF